jgi:hypothetical protein
MKLEFSKNPQIPSFIKIRPVGAELFNADGQTHVCPTAVVFRDSVNVPNKSLQLKGHKEAPCPCDPFDWLCSYQILTTGPFFRAAIFFQNTGHRFFLGA